MRFSLFHFSPFPKILTGLFFTVGFISFVFSLNAEEKNARFESAKELYHKGNYYEAHHLLEKEIHQGFSTATREEAIYLNAECLVKLNRDKEAREQFYLFLREYPYSRYLLPVSQRLGELDFQSRNFEQAITWYKNALDKSSSDETSAITSFNVGESYLAFGDSTNALKYSLLSTEFSASSLVAEKAFVLSAGLLYANGKIGEASILYDTLLVLFPGSPSAKIARIKNVEILFAQGKFTKVLEVIDATDIDSLSIDEQAHLSYAGIQSALALKNYHKTIFLSEQFLQRFPEHKKTGEVRLMLGRLYFQEKRIFEAEEIFRDAVGKKDEHSSAALYHLASTLKFNGKNEESRSLFEQVSKEQNSPFQSYGLFEQSLLSFSERRYAEAELFLQKIFSLDSLNSVFKNDSVLYAQCSRLLGAVYYTQERYNDARKMFTVARSVKGIPDTLRSEILWNEGWAMYKLGKFSGAAQCFETVAGKSTNQRDVYFFWTGEACYRAGNFDKAKVYYSQITEQHKTSAYYAEAISGYGWCAFAQRDYYEAEKAFEKLILEQPNSSIVQEAYLRLGDAYYFLKQYRNAASAYKKVLEIFPGSEQSDYVAFQIASTTYRAGNLTQAVEQLQLFPREFPRSPFCDDAQFAIGNMYFQERHFRNAIADFEKFLADFPTSLFFPRAIVGIGDSYYNLRQYEKAIQTYQRLLRELPDSKEVVDALRGISDCYALQDNEEEAKRIVEEFYKLNPQAKRSY